MTKNYKSIPDELHELGREIADAAFKVHKALGPGLIENIYEVCFTLDLTKKGIKSVRQVDIPITYDGIVIEKT